MSSVSELTTRSAHRIYPRIAQMLCLTIENSGLGKVGTGAGAHLESLCGLLFLLRQEGRTASQELCAFN